MNDERFFVNKDCKYFPCHKVENEERFNCLFCYCPLYYLGRKCGGNFEITSSGIKSCMNCNYPHDPEHYEEIMKKLKANPVTISE